MSKNLTLKGAAFGALVALSVASVAPANAVVNDSAVSLVPASGTKYSIVQDNVFDLTSDVSLAAVAGSGDLKFLVTDPSKVSVYDYQVAGTANDGAMLTDAFDTSATDWTTSITSNVVTITDATDDPFGALAAGDVISLTGLNSTTIAGAITGYFELASASAETITFKYTHANAASGTATAGTLTEATDGDALDSYAALKAVAPATLATAAVTGLAQPTRATDGSYVVDTAAQGTADTDTLRLVSTAAAGTSSTVTVTAWIDENDNGTIESTEDSSTTRTITFVPWASAGAALTFTQPVAGGSSYAATVAFGSDINAKQITAGRLTVGLGRLSAGAIVSGTAVTTAASGAFTAGNLTQWNDTKGYWEAHVGGTAGVAHLFDNNGDSDTADAGDNKFVADATYVAQILVDGAVYGSAVYKAISAGVADAVSNVGATRDANTQYNGSTGVTVRSGTKSVTVSAKATKSSVAVAGAAVTVTVARSVLHADSTFTVNGTTITSTSTTSSVSYDTVTGADGKVNVVIANSQGKANDAVTVTVVHAGISSSATTVTWLDVVHTATKFDEAANINNSIRNIAKGGTYNLTWNVADEYGVAPTTDWRVKAVYTFLGTSQTQVVKSIPVTAGVATLAVTDGSTATGSYSVVATLQKLNTSTVAYEDVDPAGDPTTITMTSTIYVGASSVPATATINVGETTAGGPGAITLEPADFAAADRRINANQAASAYAAGDYFAISGLITDATGVAVPGAVVTITSNAGDLVSYTVDGVTTIGTATVVADASGNYASVEARSHKAGDILFTATSGAATKTLASTSSVQARNGALAADIKTVKVSAAAQINSGYATSVKITVLDKWGNAVFNANGISVTTTGIGYAASTPTAVSAADGTATFTYITLPAEKGSVVVTVVAAGATAATSDDVTGTATILVGAAAAPSAVVAASGSTGKFYVSATNAANRTVVIKVGGKFVKSFVPTSATKKVVVYVTSAGNKAVTVFVGGKLALTKTVTVK